MSLCLFNKGGVGLCIASVLGCCYYQIICFHASMRSSTVCIFLFSNFVCLFVFLSFACFIYIYIFFFCLICLMLFFMCFLPSQEAARKKVVLKEGKSRRQERTNAADKRRGSVVELMDLETKSIQLEREALVSAVFVINSALNINSACHQALLTYYCSPIKAFLASFHFFFHGVIRRSVLSLSYLFIFLFSSSCFLSFFFLGNPPLF